VPREKVPTFKQLSKVGLGVEGYIHPYSQLQAHLVLNPGERIGIQLVLKHDKHVVIANVIVVPPNPRTKEPSTYYVG
jgi:hypothetical protein